MFSFQISAVQEGFESDSAIVTVVLADANDNAPVFDNDQYILQIPEDAVPDTSIFTLVVSLIFIALIFSFLYGWHKISDL